MHSTCLHKSLRRGLVALTAALITLSPALAQGGPHSHLLPASTVAAVSYLPGGIDLSVLEPALADLDVAGANEIFTRLSGVSLLGERDLTFDGLITAVIGDAVSSMAAECPQLTTVTAGGFDYLAGPVTVAVTASQFDPLPGVVALLTPADGTRAAALVSGVASCFQAGTTSLQQDGVDLYQFGGATGGGGVLSFFDDVVLLASDADLARSVARLARGSTEPSFRSSAVGAVAAEVVRPGVSVVVDGGAIANLAAVYDAGNPGADPLTDRLIASLRTLGGFGLHIGLGDRGLEVSTVLTPNEAGGDAALASLLACAGCVSLAPPSELPGGTVTVAAGTLPIGHLAEWIDGWLATSAAMTGETTDLRGLVSEYLGLDLDAGLLSWWDGVWYSVQLELPDVDLQTFLHGASSVTVLPVSSEAAAVAAIDQWAAGLSNLARLAPTGVLQALFGMVAFEADSDPDGEAPLFYANDVTYRGITYQRWRAAPVLDIGVMVEDGQLLIATPASAMRQIIDFRSGAARGTMDARLQSAIASIPHGAVGYTVHDLPRALAHYASLFDTVATPIASSITMSLNDLVSDMTGFGDDDLYDYYDDDFWNDYSDDLSPTGMGGYPADHFGANPRLPETPYNYLMLSSTVETEITSDSQIARMNLGLVYDLAGLTPGELVLVEVEDPDPYTIDTMLFLFDLSNGQVVAANDDAPNTNRSAIVFEVQEGVDYAAVVTSWSGMSTGRVVLSASLLSSDGLEETPADLGAVTPPGIVEPEYPSEWDDLEVDAYEPTFSELLQLFDFASGFIDALARISGVLVSSTHVDDGVVRSTLVVPIGR